MRVILSVVAAFAVTACGLTDHGWSIGTETKDLSDREASAGIKWSAGMETGDLSEWDTPGGINAGGGEFNSGGGDSWASQDIARTGRWAAKLVLSNGAGGTRLFRWSEAAQHPAAYYSAWFYFPKQFQPAVWWNIFQFKSKVSEVQNDAFWALNVGNRSSGAMYLYLYEQQRSKSHEQTAADLPVNRWVHIECFLRQSATNSGQLKCWQDGVLLWDLHNVTTRYPNATNQWSVNNYTDAVSPAPVVTYVDDAAVSLTRVWPGN